MTLKDIILIFFDGGMLRGRRRYCSQKHVSITLLARPKESVYDFLSLL
jgi:hypothetical protein